MSRVTAPYAGVMVLGRTDEHAALVALLQARPDGLSWQKVTAELLEVGSALGVWERHGPAPTLVDLPRRRHDRVRGQGR